MSHLSFQNNIARTIGGGAKFFIVDNLSMDYFDF